MYHDAPCNLLLEFSQIKNYILHGKIVWLKFAWIEQQTLLPTFRYIDLFQDKSAFTLNEIQITLKRKFGES